MTPQITRTGRWVLIASGSLLVYGVLARALGFVLVANVILIAIAATYLRSIRWTWALDTRRVSLAVEGPHELAIGAAAQRLGLRVENRSSLSGDRVALVPVVGSGVRMAGGVVLGRIHGQSGLAIDAELTGTRVGRWAVHGATVTIDDMLGWVRVTGFLPARHIVRVWPSQRALFAELPRRRRAPQLPAGAHRVDRAGQGFEIRELRDHVPGDPLRRVDWKATARRGTLTVRDMEEEVLLRLVVVLDVSASMRGGVAGARLNHALGLALELIEITRRAGDQLAVVSHTDRMIGALPLGKGPLHTARARRHVHALANVVHDDLTEASEHDVTEMVVEYAASHFGLNFRRSVTAPSLQAFAPTEELFHVERLTAWAGRKLAEDRSAERALEAAGVPISRASVLRRFAWACALELPFRHEPRGARRAEGIAAALKAAGATLKRGGAIVVVSDWEGVAEGGEVRDSLRQLVAQRTLVTAALPFAPSYEETPEEGVSEAVFAALSARERRQMQARQAWLETAGAAVVHVGPESIASEIIARARSAQRRR